MTSVLLITAVLASAASDVVTGCVTLEPPEIPFHRQARYTVVVEAPVEVEVQLPQMGGKFGGLEVYGAPEQTVEMLPENRRRIKETYILDPVLIGEYAIQPAEIQWGDGQKLTLPSPGLRVRDLTPEETAAAMDFAANAAPMGMPNPLFQHWKWWLAGLSAFWALAGAYVYWRLRRKNAERRAQAVPPWENAYARLRELDLRHLPQAGQWEAYYVELSDILRWYIEARFQLHAPERTTPEFLAEAAVSGIFTAPQQEALARFMRHSDRVKFARYEPTVLEMDGSFAQVLHFIDETVPRMPAAPVQQEAAA
ncbi:MAG: hypothetical protein HY706_14180 [Candidatus Hydrogenedentes bacterium]|nr:hypothetical protein [Candidatus Hydrogenedentota bacterium]